MKYIKKIITLLKNIILQYNELKYLAYHDSLTGLLNRNWLYKNINTVNKKYVYFIDINNLHEINKQGHTFGDNYIKQCVNSITNTKNNIFIRYAGDEFILFSDIENYIINTNEYSVGCCKIKNNILEAINIADKRMLQSKRNYRSKI